MKVIVGHSKVLKSIPNPLPQTLLITGPEGVGKRQIAKVFAVASGVEGLDFQNLGRLDKEQADAMLEHHSRYPLESSVKTTIADLTKATPEAVHSILKLLEEPPAYSRIILHSDTTPLLTIRSRCFSVQVGTLSDVEVREVLTRLKTPEHLLDEAVKASQGRVSRALAYVEQRDSRKAVEKILQAVAEQSGDMLESSLREALQPGEDESVHRRREVVAALLVRAIRASLTVTDHFLSFIPMNIRLHALGVLESSSRPVLKIRSAAWSLIGD